ncbi:Tim44/TimA family putative adaptor protein [Rickettsia endosymbiont of Halotydeus destructor]|uniref:Tim44/TimA family putative adaptor protein n=1 Tax=Rickettsia endosymbiont of Halotydeus destructor TaxID=2996754 RepID=UPI003BB1C688
MSAQIIELLIFAGIAFFIINKLITTLGSTSDDDPTKHKSYFGEPTVKDVTSTSSNSNDSARKNQPVIKDLKALEGLIVEQNLTPVFEGLEMLQKRLRSFQPISFINNAKAAFQMIIEAITNKQKEELGQLIDKRFLEKFEEIAPDYGDFIDSTSLNAQFSEIYMFGNNVFIKLLFQGKNVVDKLENLKEEWTFTRSINTSDVDWFLSNVERV